MPQLLSKVRENLKYNYINIKNHCTSWSVLMILLQIVWVNNKSTTQ